MKLYTCDKCNNLLYFENNVCLQCGLTVGFDPEKLDLITLQPRDAGDVFINIAAPHLHYRYCANAIHGTCNWLVTEKDSTFCRACALNRMIPALTPQNIQLWKRIEIAKHRLIYSLLRLDLPIMPKSDRNVNGLIFDFLENVTPEKRVLTGHANGIVTLNIEEADEAQRVRNKLNLEEKYRTLLGHFRHEIGHYYWDILVKDHSAVEPFRKLFGDERQNYEQALKTYYASGATLDWADHFITPYATSHPWEDWAESWSHYLHMMDTLETAYYFGLDVHPKRRMGIKNLDSKVMEDPYSMSDFNKIFQVWLPLTFAINSLNRGMGHPDFYPFVIAPVVIQKLQFIHELVGNHIDTSGCS